MTQLYLRRRRAPRKRAEERKPEPRPINRVSSFAPPITLVGITRTSSRRRLTVVRRKGISTGQFCLVIELLSVKFSRWPAFAFRPALRSRHGYRALGLRARLKVIYDVAEL